MLYERSRRRVESHPGVSEVDFFVDRSRVVFGGSQSIATGFG